MGNSGIKQHIQNAEKTGVCQLCNMGLTELPEELQRLAKNLRTLDLSSNKLAALPPSMGKFTVLKSLTANNNRLASLPEDIFALKKLDTLSLSRNRLTTIPPSISRLAALKTLTLSGNGIKQFPLEISALRHLDVLDLSSNAITEIPSGCGGVQAIEINLNQNQISTISESIADCPRLKVLRLEENCLQLMAVPSKILTNSNVSLLALDGNLFEMKNFQELEGYETYMERYTAAKKKMF
ncbi:leucine-rich repeat-containing protein 57-like [Diadema setosum]|uniref:leucine-rich repeat-containing protein 57-like n=1 Tax=Diadema setosum TaxID=31175 RepID=UPI003B3BE934